MYYVRLNVGLSRPLKFQCQGTMLEVIFNAQEHEDILDSVQQPKLSLFIHV
jgi:hypothetical protein